LTNIINLIKFKFAALTEIWKLKTGKSYNGHIRHSTKQILIKNSSKKVNFCLTFRKLTFLILFFFYFFLLLLLLLFAFFTAFLFSLLAWATPRGQIWFGFELCCCLVFFSISFLGLVLDVFKNESIPKQINDLICIQHKAAKCETCRKVEINF